MNLKYYADVKDKSNNDVRLEIYVQEYSGEPEEIILQREAITIEYCADTLFDSLKPSLAHINILNPDLRLDLYSSNYNDIIVKIFKNSSLFWVGYVTPNIYNQPYKYPYDPMTLECVDIISNLGNMKYNSNAGITSLLSIIEKCLNMSDPNHIITNLYIDTNISLNDSDKVLDYAFIDERNFFDEKMEPANCDEVVGSIFKCLGLTMVQYKDAFYVVEQSTNLLSSYTLNKYIYDNGWAFSTTYTLALPVRSSNTIGVAASNGQISLDNVYNKVTVVANNNPLDGLLPEFNDKEDLENQNIDQQHYEQQTYLINENTYILLAAYFKSKNNWFNYPTYTIDSSSLIPVADEVDEVHMSTLSDSANVVGMLWNRVSEYNQEDGEPATLSWKTYISILNSEFSGYSPNLELKKKPTMIFDGGYLIINLTYKLSTSRFPHGTIKSQYDNFSTQGYYDKTWTNSTAEIGAGSWPNYTMFPCLIKIGNYFYNGEQWILQSDYDAKVAWWNSIYNAQGLDQAGTQNRWYRIWNTTYNDWEYVTESQYNSFSGTKSTGLCDYAYAHYVTRSQTGNTYIYISNEFYYQRNYGNYCLLTRANVVGDNIMDTEYQLTNTVSYKMNIIDASEGMAIKIDQPLYGEVQFKLYEPIDNKYGRILGRDPQPQQSKATGTCRAVHISNLTLKYQKTTSYQDIFNNQDINPDTIYTNVINSNYCKELEDVTLTVNTANDWANSYSYLIKQNNGSYDYIKSLNFNGSSKRPEERLVEKYVNYYSTPRLQYGNTLFNSKASSGIEIYPFQPIQEQLNGSNKNFIVNNITYDLIENTADINAFQI